MNDNYLVGRVTTASQPELQLMLLDGAQRYSRKARQIWDAADQRVERQRLLERSLDILEELARSVSAGATEASKRLSEEYSFLFRRLATATFNEDLAALDETLTLLEYQRDTWRLACEKTRPQTTAAPVPHVNLGMQLPTSGFSFQA
jgi:flagellar biosynthetic protein FliS